MKGTVALGTIAAAAGAMTACGGGSASAASASAASSSAAASGGAMSPTMAEFYEKNPLVAADAKWEEIYRFEPGDSAMIEGMNFTKDGVLWFIDIGMGRIMKLDLETRELEKLIDHGMMNEQLPMMPNGARIIDDDTLLIADRNSGLCTFTGSGKEKYHNTCKYDRDYHFLVVKVHQYYREHCRKYDETAYAGKYLFAGV